MNELIMRALSYVDDRWITEAMSDYETVKMKHFFSKRTQKKISLYCRMYCRCCLYSVHFSYLVYST